VLTNWERTEDSMQPSRFAHSELGNSSDRGTVANPTDHLSWVMLEISKEIYLPFLVGSALHFTMSLTGEMGVHSCRLESGKEIL
jgi:hypothetical protein